VLQRRPNTFAQTNLSTSFFACDKAADHTFRFADNEARLRRGSNRYPVNWAMWGRMFATSGALSSRIVPKLLPSSIFLFGLPFVGRFVSR